MSAFSFVQREFALQRAAAAGSFTAAESLARVLGEQGHSAIADGRLDGTATVTVETAAALSSLRASLTANRAVMITAISAALSKAIRERALA